MCIIAIPEGEDEDKEAEEISEVMTGNIFNLMENINLYIQENQQTPSIRNSN